MPDDHFDDPSIPDHERLFRRIHLVHVAEGSEGRSALSSAAFRDKELSVNLESVMRQAGKPPDYALRNHPHDFLAGITAGVCRANGQRVGPDPLPDEPAHGYVFGDKPKRIRRALRDAACWIVPAQAPSWEEVLLRKRKLGIAGEEDGGGLDPTGS